MSVVGLKALALGAVLLAGTAWASAATHTAASCAQPDVEAAVARASPGDTVLIPAGTAAWTDSISLRKGIHLKGAGGGGFIGHSRTALSISTGTKAFVTPAGLDLPVGCRVRATYIANGTQFLEGTVTSFIMSLRRNCLYAGHPYPVPRQVGQGHDGTGYVLDPLYIWNNPGDPRVGVNDYEPDEVGRDLRTADYLKPGRDYHVGVAKPGYQKFTYPHPLRAAAAGRDAVAGDPVRFQLRTVDAAGPASPWTKIAGDLDGDGRDDLIVGGQKGSLVWYQWPDFRKHTIAESGWSTVSGAVGDVDADGDLDVLMGGSVWFENPGNLRAAPGQPWKLHRIAQDPTHDIAAADFNGDGRLDAVTRNQSEFGAKSGNKIRVWLQQPESRWPGVELDCPQGEGLAVADLDRDGDPDIVIGGTWFETIRESGQVRWQANRFAEFHRNATVAVADFNGDGRPDVALAPSELAGQQYRVSWFEAPADPRTSFWREHRLADPIEAVVHSLAAADFDRDGRMDIAFAEMHQGADPDEVGLFLNRGAAHPWEKVVVSTTGSHGLQIPDVDGDGAPDLFGANWSGPLQSVQLWHNLADSWGRVSAGRATPARELRKAPRGQSTAWPLKVSGDGRYLVDQSEQPFLLICTMTFAGTATSPARILSRSMPTCGTIPMPGWPSPAGTSSCGPARRWCSTEDARARGRGAPSWAIVGSCTMAPRWMGPRPN